MGLQASTVGIQVGFSTNLIHSYKGASGEYVHVSLGARCIKDCIQLQHIMNPIAAVVGSGCDYIKHPKENS